jgi:hypothetical protein
LNRLVLAVFPLSCRWSGTVPASGRSRQNKEQENRTECTLTTLRIGARLRPAENRKVFKGALPALARGRFWVCDFQSILTCRIELRTKMNEP